MLSYPYNYIPAPEERTYGMLCHLLAFSTFIVPFGNILGPLVMWLIKKDSSPYVDANGKEALNFQISIMIYLVASGVLMLILIGFILALAVFVFWIVAVIIACVKANEGVVYRYPLTIRFFT